MTIQHITDETAFEVFSGTLAGLFKETQIGRCNNIKFEWGPPTETAHWDHLRRVVVVPWPGKKPSAEQYEILRGYTLHEMGHGMFTPDDSLKQAYLKYGATGKDVANILEDQRINYVLKESFSTLKSAFAAIWNHLIKTGGVGDQAKRKAQTPKVQLVNDLLSMTAGITHLAPPTSDQAVQDRLREWLTLNHSDVVGDRTKWRPTYDSLERTESFMLTFDDILNPPKPEQKPDEGDGDEGEEGKKDKTTKKNKTGKKPKPSDVDHSTSEDEKEPGDSDESGDTDDTDEQSGDDSKGDEGAGDDEGEEGESSDGDAEETGEDGDGGDESEDGQEADGDAAGQDSSTLDALNKGSVFSGAEENNRAYKDIAKTREAADRAVNLDSLTDVDPAVREYVARNEADEQVGKVRRLGANCASVVRQAFAANARTADLTDLDDGELDPDKFPELARGQWNDPFMKPGRIVHSRNTAVHVCIDGSSSMKCLQLPGTAEAMKVLQQKVRVAVRAQVGMNSSNTSPTVDQTRAAMIIAVEVMLGTKAADYIRQFPHLIKDAIGNQTTLDAARLVQYVPYVVNTFAKPASQVAGAAFALHDAMRGARVPHEISGFLHEAYIVYKNFRNPVMNPQQRKMLDTGPSHGNTPAGQAWKRAVGSLVLRREPRKVLLVMTDGQVEDPTASKAVLDTARGFGIEVYGVGLNDDSILNVFPKDSPAVTLIKGMLAPELISVVRKILVKAGKFNKGGQ